MDGQPHKKQSSLTSNQRWERETTKSLKSKEEWTSCCSRFHALVSRGTWTTSFSRLSFRFLTFYFVSLDLLDLSFNLHFVIRNEIIIMNRVTTNTRETLQTQDRKGKEVINLKTGRRRASLLLQAWTSSWRSFHTRSLCRDPWIHWRISRCISQSILECISAILCLLR